ncbi:DUF543-domain-containing protein [Jaminaea rosea]|uniref:MICOS complex subunit MIC10 n=1 Tax=Jaminaea rosea TaxID=1569628 RepID=A0A316V043_9BASI|nr:DUF543-domain-containing protein [Jaminaea rosea]PWN28805.1 DUF543-domain-containing protein [Jaminaea rosea]
MIARKTDLCISNAIVKTGIGFGTGVVLSVLLFRRRAFPVWLGTGFGMGSAYTDCERSFNPYSAPGLRILPPSAKSASEAPRSTLEMLSQKTGEAFGTAKEKVAEETKDARKEVKKMEGKVEQKVGEVKEEVKSKVRQV